MEKKHSHKCIPNNSQRPASLGMHRDSKTISRSTSSNNKPKIRIIHIFAPQIIKTDVENFRELVQRKTGKPPPSDAAEKMCKPTTTTTILAASGREQECSRRSNNSNSLNSGLVISDDDDKPKSKNKKMVELRNKFTVKKEQVCISDEISSGGYLRGFSDLEEGGFISELGGFSMLPLDCKAGLEESHSHLL